jgi:hypothetical protein
MELERASTVASLKTMHSVRKRIGLGQHVPTKCCAV